MKTSFLTQRTLQYLKRSPTVYNDLRQKARAIVTDLRAPSVTHVCLEGDDDLPVRRTQTGVMDTLCVRLTCIEEGMALDKEPDGKLLITKYRLHWQDAAGRLLKRWDNAAHHPHISTHPHHVHDGSEENVSSYERLSAEEILAMIASSPSSR